MKIPEILSKPVPYIIVIVIVLLVGLAAGFFTCYKWQVQGLQKKLDIKTEQILEVKKQAEIDIQAAKKEAEIEKIKATIEIENMPADAVAIRFLTDAEIVGRTDYIDGIAKKIIDHSLQFFREMGIHFATINNTDVE